MYILLIYMYSSFWSK